ncbi:MAG: transporter substrate-binding domain-containing protein [Caldilineaceae bacterium]
MPHAFGFHRQGFRHPALRWLSTLLIVLTCSTLFSAFVDAQTPPWTATNTPATAPTTPLRVYTKPLEPFVMGTGDQLRGFSVELWAEVARRLNLPFRWIEKQKVSEILDAVKSGEGDVAIAGISMTPEREAQLDFTHPYFNAGLQIMTRAGADVSFDSVFRLIMNPALLQILFVGLIIMLVMAHIIWLAERKTHPEMPAEYLPGIWEAIWWALGTIANAEYAGTDSRVVWRRLLAIFWIVLGVVLIAQFTASVTSLLTVQQLQGTINGIADLPGKSIATVPNTTAARYLAANNLPFTSVEKIEDAYKLLEQGKVDAIVYDSPVLLYHALTTGKGRTQVVGRIFQQEQYGIALPTGSPLREPINETLLEIQEDGTYDALYTKWFGSLN